jgi:predicted lipoprotein with Yx(FWY)xxD motif
MIRLKLLACLAGAMILASCAGDSSGPARVGDSAMGKVLTDAKGMTLYTFDRDASGKSNCNGQCAQNWPPLTAAATAQAQGEWSIVTRDDGSKMWAYKGKPVYGWVKDQKAGDTTGEGVNNVWHVARP